MVDLTVRLFNDRLNRGDDLTFEDVGDWNLLIGQNYKRDAGFKLNEIHKVSYFCGDYETVYYKDVFEEMEKDVLYSQTEYSLSNHTFTSTESIDAIKEFYNLSKKYTDLKFVLYRCGHSALRDDRDSLIATDYSMELLGAALEMGWEIR
jgi:DNA polymerase III epsilon subunit-like protein